MGEHAAHLRARPRVRRVRGFVAWAFALGWSLPALVLGARALADVWRSPAVLPQSWGLRGVRYAVSGTAGVGDAIGVSVAVAVATTALALVLGWSTARALGERRLPWPGLVFLVVLAPLLVSPYAVGTGLASWFIRLGLSDRHLGLVLSHLVYVLPYVVVLLAPGFGPRVRALEEAAAVAGAGPWRRLVLVTVPAVAPWLGSAVLLGFLVSLSQYGTSLAVGGGLPTLPLVLLPFVRSDPQVAAVLSLVLLAPAVVVLVLTTRASEQR